jgi:hypothetical protein
MKVVRVTEYDGNVGSTGLVDVYDITVDTAHRYYASNVLVSNSKKISMLDVNALMSHGACFVGSVNVLTENGFMPISEIVSKRLPIKVACANPATGEVTYRPVIDWLCRCVPSSELMQLEIFARTSGGYFTRRAYRTICCTRGHEFYTPNGKVQAYYLKPGDLVYTVGTKDGLQVPAGDRLEETAVKSVKPYKVAGAKNSLVYNITVQEHHNYIVHGVLVGNTETLRDAGSIRGQKNEEWWLQFMQGYNPTHVKVPMVYDAFLNDLRASGIHVVRTGHQTHVMGLTDAHVNQLASNRYIKHGDTIRFDKELKPVPGGLFDPQLTGGHGGRLWSKIKLEEALPNPVMEEPIRRVLGLTQKKFESVISGEESLPKYGTGLKAIEDALDGINLPREIDMARTQMNSATKSKRDEAVRKLGFLKGTQQQGQHPRDWILHSVPVLPPMFRPVSILGTTGTPLVADPNYLYKELFEANNNLANMKKVVGNDGAGPERLAAYHAFKALTGLGDPVSKKLQEKSIKGILNGVFGSSPKWSVMQNKLLSSTVDNVGRAVITPDPDLDLDSVGLPEDKAFEVYKRFITRRLARRGMPLTQALDQIANKTPLAKDMLIEEMNSRPVIINRAPVLHKFGIMAFKPKLMKGNVMRVNPLIVTGFNADFDGDQMQFHVPTSEEAKQEAYERLLPSKNLIASADFKTPMHAPTHEYHSGLYELSAAQSSRRPRYFHKKKDALDAYARGDIRADDRVVIMEND